MRRNRAVIVACLFAALQFGSAAAAVSSSIKPLDLYVRGDYAAAIEAGEKANDGEGLAVAARAVLAEADLGDAPCLSCLQRAEAYAQRAIDADPKRTEAYVYYAITLGYEARIIGIVRARLANYPAKSKRALDTALMVSPADAWTLAALGGWNIEVVRGGGSLVGRVLFGASFDNGVDYFRRGIAADPENLILRFQYALSLAGYDVEENRAEIEAALINAAGEMPRTAYEKVIKMRAANLLDLLRTDKANEFRAAVSRYQGFP